MIWVTNISSKDKQAESYKLDFAHPSFFFTSCLQVNTEPAKSKTFNLVVNKQEVEEGSKEEAWGRKSDDDASSSGEILGSHGFVLGEDFGDSSEVLVRSGLEANTVRPVMVSSEAEVPVVTTKHQEEKEEQEVEEVEEVELLEKEKQSRSIVSVRLGEEGSRFSFAKVIHFSQCHDDIANIIIFFTIFFVILYHHTRWKWAKNQVTAQLWR